MYEDPQGNAPKWWQWVLFGIGAALVVTAAVVAAYGTFGIGAFGMGALIGSLSLEAVGAAVGGVIGYATGGTEGILGGVLAGFGIGAIVGFVVGGIIGFAKYPQPGVPFNKQGIMHKVQTGVNPHTLKPNRMHLSDTKKVKNFTETILRGGRFKNPINVSRLGEVNQGHHRIWVAKLLKLTIDVFMDN